MEELTKEQAIALGESGWWENATDLEIATFQLNTKLLCMPFGELHRAVESALGRPVYTHEFGSGGGLREELNGDKPPPTIEEIINLIPAEKLIILNL